MRLAGYMTLLPELARQFCQQRCQSIKRLAGYGLKLAAIVNQLEYCGWGLWVGLADVHPGDLVAAVEGLPVVEGEHAEE